jgi:hypothetical protein
LKIKRRNEKRWRTRLKIKNEKTIQSEEEERVVKQVKTKEKPK